MKIRQGFVSNSSSSSFIIAYPPQKPMTKEEKLAFIEEYGHRRTKHGDRKALTQEEIDIIMHNDVILKVMDDDWNSREEAEEEFHPIVVSETFMVY